MKNKTLILMCGPAGCGKSSWVSKELESKPFSTTAYISRDSIRFALVAENEEYFSKEDEVFGKFITMINTCLADSVTETIYVDATHLTEKARNKVLDKLNINRYGYIVDINVVAFDIPLKTCLERNAQRLGRMRVPEDVIRNMYKCYKIPTYAERHRYEKIIIVREDGSEYEQ